MTNRSKEGTKDAKFYISKEDWNKVIAYAESSYHQFKSEIGGQLIVVEDEEGDFVIKDPVILKQTVSSGNCEMEAESLALHYSKMVSKYGDNVRHCWWHSHHNMGAFWSPTDDATIMNSKTQDFSISLVVNLKQEYKLRIQFFYPFEHEENIVLNFIEDANEIRNVELDTQVKELCTKEVVAITKYQKPNNGAQAGIWDDEMQDWNSSFGNQDYNSYQRYKVNKLDMDKVPPEKVKPINDLIEEVQDKLIDNNCSYQEFLEMRKTVNESIKEYNIRMKFMKKEDLEACTYHYWPEDFLENIEGRDTIVHK